MMKVLSLLLISLLAAVSAIEIYNHLPLHSTTYVRHEHGRVRRNAGGIPANPPKDNKAHMGKSGRLVYPPRMLFTFEINGETVTLNLKLNHKQIVNTPIKIFANGAATRVDKRAPRDHAFYQEMGEHHGASVMVKCEVPDTPCCIVGRFIIGMEEFAMECGTNTPTAVNHGQLHNIYTVPPASQTANSDDISGFILDDDRTVHPRENGNGKGRAKRQTTPIGYEVELMMVADCTIYNYWYSRLGSEAAAIEQIGQYLEQLACSMDLRYQTADTSSMQISIIPFEIFIMTSCTESPWVNNMGYVDGSSCLLVYDALDDFETWVDSIYSTEIDPSVDAIQTYTREDLASSTSSGTAGLARMIWRPSGLTASLPCLMTKMALSIVEDGAYSGIERSAAHELAHNFGVSHDPTVGCLDTDKYTMSTSSGASVPSSIALNPWKFSSCSIAELERTLSDNYDDASVTRCLSEGSTYNVTVIGEIIGEQRLGELYSLDQQCELRVGLNSVACTASSTYPISNMCYNGLLCSSTTGSCTSSIKLIPAFARSPCETGKYCVAGACVDIPVYCDQSMAEYYETYYGSFTPCLVYTCIATCPSGSSPVISCTNEAIPNCTA